MSIIHFALNSTWRTTVEFRGTLGNVGIFFAYAALHFAFQFLGLQLHAVHDVAQQSYALYGVGNGFEARCEIEDIAVHPDDIAGHDGGAAVAHGDEQRRRDHHQYQQLHGPEVPGFLVGDANLPAAQALVVRADGCAVARADDIHLPFQLVVLQLVEPLHAAAVNIAHEEHGNQHRSAKQHHLFFIKEQQDERAYQVVEGLNDVVDIVFEKVDELAGEAGVRAHAADGGLADAAQHAGDERGVDGRIGARVVH